MSDCLRDLGGLAREQFIHTDLDISPMIAAAIHVGRRSGPRWDGRSARWAIWSRRWVSAISAGVAFASRLPERRMRLAFSALLLLTAVLLALRG